MTGGDVTIADARPEHMEMLLRKVGQMGVGPPWAPRAAGQRGGRLVAADVATLPLPRRGDRLQPVAGGHAHGGRRRRDPDREPVLRAGSATWRSCAAWVRTSGPRAITPSSAACRSSRAPRCAPRHPGRRGPRPGRAGGRGGRGRERRPPHRPGLRGPGRRRCAAWVPRSERACRWSRHRCRPIRPPCSTWPGRGTGSHWPASSPMSSGAATGDGGGRARLPSRRPLLRRADRCARRGKSTLTDGLISEVRDGWPGGLDGTGRRAVAPGRGAGRRPDVALQRGRHPR